MRSLFIAALLATLPLFVNAQEGYEITGSFDVIIDEAQIELTSIYDQERQRSDIRTGKFDGTKSIKVAVRNLEDPLRFLSFPRVHFEIGPSGDDENSYEADVTYVGVEGLFEASSSLQNRLQMVDFTLTDDTLSFSVNGELLPVASPGAYETDETRDPLLISGFYVGSHTLN